MRKFYTFCTLVLCAVYSLHAQDFSNKGKDFWVGYGYHQVMTSGNGQQMVLYFATEAVTTVTVTIPGIGYSQTYSNIAANTVFTSNPLPKSSPDARLMTEGVLDKGIHIIADHPIVAYAHIYNSNVSGATVLFPTNTLGKEYYSVNYKNISNSDQSNCWFYVIACDTGTTTVEITPSANTLSHVAGTPFTVTLNQGQIYNVMGELSSRSTNPYTGVDLTGSKIRSISTGTGSCKRIAVFSGSGRIAISCNGTAPSSDNYMVQAMPRAAWGKKYLTVPTSSPMMYNFFRICVSDPATVVTVNGAPIAVPLTNGFYYELGPVSSPMRIESDQPVTVAQYITSQGQCGNGSPGDPEVIYLSPVEQNIDKVLWNATPNFAITEHFFSLIIPNGGTGLSSFKLDGVSIAPSLFTTDPQDAAYSYLIQPVSVGQHTITSDSGFNAIAYGYGSTESYGYSAGTNVKDLYQFITIRNEFASVNFPSSCKGSPFNLYMTFPYQPMQIEWLFNGLFPDVTINSPVYDSTWVVNGKQLYRYALPTPYTINTPGTYPIQVIAQNPTVDGCSGEQEVDFDIQVFDRPVATFNFATNGCLSNPVQFTNTSPNPGRPITNYSWNFGDGNTGSVANPSHAYTGPGTYNVQFSLITDVGCVSDTAAQQVVLTNPPVANFSTAAPYCAGKLITFTDNSVAATGSVLVKWIWDFGDGSPAQTVFSNTAQQHSYTSAGIYTVSLVVETSTGCQSTAFTQTITIHPNPVAAFSFPNVCLPSGQALFTNQSTISDGTQSQFTYAWNFGDGGTAGNIQNPTHTYLTTGPFNVTLTVTSNNGCADDSIRSVNTIYAQPQAVFTAPSEVCFGSVVNFIDGSSAANSSVTQWNWDFGDGTTSTTQNPAKNYSAAGTYTVTLTVTSAIGCVSNTFTKQVIVDPLPTPLFNVSAPTCATRDVTFTDASLANAGNLIKWTWDYGDATTAVLNNNNPFTHNYNSTGTYHVTLKVETDKGCVSSLLAKDIVVSPLPVANFGIPESCLSDPFSQFTDSSLIADGTESQFTYNWNFGDPNANPGDPNTSTIKNPLHKYTATGPYNITLTVTSNNGCASTISKPFFVNGAIPIPSFTVAGGTAQCSSNMISISNTSTVNPGNVVKLEIYWDNTVDPTIKTTDEDPVPGKVYTHNYTEFGSPASRTATIKLVAYSGQTCLMSVDQVITLYATPQIQFNSLAGVCADVAPFTINQASETNNQPGTGVYSGPGISPDGLFDPAVAGAGVHTIRYTFTNDNGCSNYKEQTIEVYPIPVISAGPDRFVLEGGNITIQATATGNNLSYLWTPNIAMNNNQVLNPVVSPSDDITYTLKVNSADGCTATDAVFVKVLKTPVIPNIFSPNGDGIHDKWEIPYLDSYPGCIVEVYNRYGQLIFRSIGYDKPWDGTISGRQAPVGTYYYIVDPKNGRQKMSGYVDIIR